MSNFKLTDEAKQILIKALAFCDDEIVEQNRDALIQKIKDDEINDTYDLTTYYVYVKASLDIYCEMLKRSVDDSRIADENTGNDIKEFRSCIKILVLTNL